VAGWAGAKKEAIPDGRELPPTWTKEKCEEWEALSGLEKVNKRLEEAHGSGALARSTNVERWPLELLDLDSSVEATKAKKAGAVRVAMPLSKFMHKLDVRRINKQILERTKKEVMKEEVIALRLYTGPLYAKYNLVLRACGEGAPASLKQHYARICKRNKYTTTLHVINSSIVKLATANTVYRGISGGVLPDEFWEANEFGVCGGIGACTGFNQSNLFAYAQGMLV
jgi:hypothetical protein